eukprot:6302157-Prymnesium_polylepis.1
MPSTPATPATPPASLFLALATCAGVRAGSCAAIARADRGGGTRWCVAARVATASTPLARAAPQDEEEETFTKRRLSVTNPFGDDENAPIMSAEDGAP